MHLEQTYTLSRTNAHTDARAKIEILYLMRTFNTVLKNSLVSNKSLVMPLKIISVVRANSFNVVTQAKVPVTV